MYRNVLIEGYEPFSCSMTRASSYYIRQPASHLANQPVCYSCPAPRPYDIVDAAWRGWSCLLLHFSHACPRSFCHKSGLQDKLSAMFASAMSAFSCLLTLHVVGQTWEGVSLQQMNFGHVLCCKHLHGTRARMLEALPFSGW